MDIRFNKQIPINLGLGFDKYASCHARRYLRALRDEVSVEGFEQLNLGVAPVDPTAVAGIAPMWMWRWMGNTSAVELTSITHAP